MSQESIANYALVPIILVFGFFAVRARRRGTVTLGFSLRRGAVAEFAAGIGLAAVAIGVIFAVEYGAGLVTVTGTSGGAVGAVLAYVVYLLLLAAIEEMAFRGLLLCGLAVVIRSALSATVITAVLVALPYLFGNGVTVLSFVSAVLAGLMYGMAYLRTGRVWFSAGMRAAWNAVQGPVLGFTVSGTQIGSVSIVHLAGNTPAWLAGGAYGPEGGLVGILVRLAVLGLLGLALARGGRRGPWRRRVQEPVAATV